ncbi:UNVERIFIED_CONTAM: hypothetical protein FKN15_029750 [Acipenser sinensis]
MGDKEEVLISILDELIGEELKRFKFSLQSIEKKYACQHIPRSKLEHAKVTDIVSLLIDHYSDHAINMVKDALIHIKKRDLADQLLEKAETVVCWIVCEVIKDSIECGEEITRNLKTISQVFVQFVSILLKYHGNKCPSDTIHKLGSLALAGVRKHQFLFQEEELETLFSNHIQDASAFLDKILFKQNLSCRSAYHFLHLIIQELLAAMFCVSGMSDEERDKLLCEALDNSCFFNVVYFMFGLANKNTQALIPDSILLPISVLRTQLENWMNKAMTSSSYDSYVLELLHCLFEIQDEEFVRKVMEYRYTDHLELIGGYLSKHDCTVIKYCIEQCGEVRRLDLLLCILGEEEVKVLLEVLQKCRCFSLNDSHLTDSCVDSLSSGLDAFSSSLVLLDLSNNFFTDSSVPSFIHIMLKYTSLEVFKVDDGPVVSVRSRNEEEHQECKRYLSLYI